MKSFMTAIVILIMLTTLVADSSEPVLQRLEEEGSLAVTQLGVGDYDQAIVTFKSLLKLKPLKGNPELLYTLARAYAGKGNTDKAIHYLQRAVTKGYNKSDWAQVDPYLERVRSNYRFLRVVELMERNAQEWEKRSRPAHRTLDPARAPEFASYDALNSEYSHKCPPLTSLRAIQEWRWRILDEERAALRRYLSDHPQAADHEEAAVNLVRTFHLPTGNGR